MDSIDAGVRGDAASGGTALDLLVHAIGFSDKDELRGKLRRHQSLDNFLMTMNISAYSLVAVTRRAAPMMTPRRQRC